MGVFSLSVSLSIVVVGGHLKRKRFVLFMLIFAGLDFVSVGAVLSGGTVVPRQVQ